MQVLSKRIHYGKFVAEAKFQAAPDAYVAAIRAQVHFFFQMHPRARSTLFVMFFHNVLKRVLILFTCGASDVQDRTQLMDLLTYPAVEEAIKRRVETKAKTYGQEVTINVEEDGADPVYKIKPSLVADLYGDWIMPLTKEVQVEYLLSRLD